VIDGGAGQLAAAREAIGKVATRPVSMIGLAKREELVVREGLADLQLSRRSAALRALQRLRDEAHRFAITYHRMLRGKERLRSVLDAIPGVGAERRRRLLRAFGSIKRMRQATIDELAAVPGISPGLAATVRAALQQLETARNVDTRRGRLVAVPLEAEDVVEESPGTARDATGDAGGEAVGDVDSPDPGDYA